MVAAYADLTNDTDRIMHFELQPSNAHSAHLAGDLHGNFGALIHFLMTSA